MKAILILLAVLLIISAFSLGYKPNTGGQKPRLGDDLWALVESQGVTSEKPQAFSKDLPAGFRDASMGKAIAGPIKVEGG